jgi:radical SAM superfamily enzyme YgiQ (UPF0313 family)
MKLPEIPKLLLVYPPITKFERYSSAIGASGGRQIPLGIYYLAAYIRKHGYATDVVDAEAFDFDNQKIIRLIRSHHFNILGISATTVAFHRALKLAEKVKAAVPETIVIIGGPHVSSQPQHPLQFGVFDYAVRNEGEQTLLDLLRSFHDKGELADIPGLVFRKKNEISVNPKREYITDLDELPFPAYDLIPDMTRYSPPPCNYKKSPVANIITSRGCPHLCTFCDNNTFGRKVRYRSAENIAAEIEYLMIHHGVKEIAFVDDTFTLQKKRIYDLFALTRSKGLRFPWTCMAHVNTVDEELLQYMKANGCWHISFGIESGNAEILKIIRKSISLQAIEGVITACRRIGILTKGFFIVGHPNETAETIDDSIKLATRLKLDDVVVTINTPIPGSEQYRQADKYGTMDISSWSKFNYWNPVFVPRDLTRDSLLAKHKEFYRKFYIRPHIIWRYIKSFCNTTGIQRMLNILSSSRFLIPSWPSRSKR